MKRLLLVLLCIACAPLAWAGNHSIENRIGEAMVGDHRSEVNIERNAYRHPLETLTFFGLADGMTVMEIWPGGGWYTDILAPVMNGHGAYIAASWDVDVPDQPGYRYRLDAALRESIYAEFARVLKPGGVLGVVQHRAADGTDPAETAQQGYVSEEAVIAMATAAGLEFEARSDVNANPNDSHDHEFGVWTLPPSLRACRDIEDEAEKAGCQAKYQAIGESDRMTLRFRKPLD